MDRDLLLFITLAGSDWQPHSSSLGFTIMVGMGIENGESWQRWAGRDCEHLIALFDAYSLDEGDWWYHPNCEFFAFDLMATCDIPGLILQCTGDLVSADRAQAKMMQSIRRFYDKHATSIPTQTIGYLAVLISPPYSYTSLRWHVDDAREQFARLCELSAAALDFRATPASCLDS